MLGTIGVGLALFTATVVAQRGSGPDPKALTLRGKVDSIQLKPVDPSSAMIEIKLSMELVNVGVRPIILLQREPFFPGGALARKPEDFQTGNLLAGDAGWPSNEDTPEWTSLRSNLDKASPPADETRRLLPGESWKLETSVRLVVPTDPSKDTSLRKKESLATIQQLSPVWLRVVCEVWPWNVEPLNSERNKLKFGHKLQKRWKDTGILWLDQIYSEPIMISLSQL